MNMLTNLLYISIYFTLWTLCKVLHKGHNHPSGVVTPSEADCKITKKLVDAGVLLEITVLDHIILANDQFYSFADEGAL